MISYVFGMHGILLAVNASFWKKYMPLASALHPRLLLLTSGRRNSKVFHQTLVRRRDCRIYDNFGGFSRFEEAPKATKSNF
jgi:hypothetical protein